MLGADNQQHPPLWTIFCCTVIGRSLGDIRSFCSIVILLGEYPQDRPRNNPILLRVLRMIVVVIFTRFYTTRVLPPSGLPTGLLRELGAVELPGMRAFSTPTTTAEGRFSGTDARSPSRIGSSRDPPLSRLGWCRRLRLRAVAVARGSRRPSAVSLPQAIKLWRSMVHHVRSHTLRV